MASDDNVIVKEVHDFFRLYKNGRVERFYDVHGSFYVPPSPDENSNSGVFFQRRHHLTPRLCQTLPPGKHHRGEKTPRSPHDRGSKYKKKINSRSNKTGYSRRSIRTEQNYEV
ncbi:hypothetical protein RND71_022813 [Anisodus tanguticus]|uniref:Uncharacterized protein n=1 Tax=Anisodus tanguticus TaxID=243964 RepID=A0AAE1V5I3_9SOLA|nr:hypothetical protein RND71_022813 [Anisodus tanguticus]